MLFRSIYTDNNQPISSLPPKSAILELATKYVELSEDLFDDQHTKWESGHWRLWGLGIDIGLLVKWKCGKSKSGVELIEKLWRETGMTSITHQVVKFRRPIKIQNGENL